MKKKFLIFLVASFMMCSCLKETISTETTYTGCVKNGSNNPRSNVQITVAHYYYTDHFSEMILTTYTDAYGQFNFKLNSNSFPDTWGLGSDPFHIYYVINGVVRAENTLQGLGNETFDYGTIIIN